MTSVPDSRPGVQLDLDPILYDAWKLSGPPDDDEPDYDPFADADALPPDRPEPGPPALTMSPADWLDSVAGHHRSHNSELADLVAGGVEALADAARRIGPGCTPRKMRDLLDYERALDLTAIQEQGFQSGVMVTERHYSEHDPLW